MAVRTVRFHGTENSLKAWRALVAATVGREGEAILAVPDRKIRGLVRHHFDVCLSDEDVGALMDRCWCAESGTGANACGDPYRSNDRVTFEVVKAGRK